MRILGISGSLRSASTNALLLRAAAAVAPPLATFDWYDRQFAGLPHFSPDLDEEGATPPDSVAEWRSALAAVDAVLVSCPEYAHGVPGSFKNALDWIVSSGELTAKPLALLMASPSGARNAWTALVPTLRVMGAEVLFEESLVLARRHFDDAGRLVDADIEAVLRRALDALAASVVDRRDPSS